MTDKPLSEYIDMEAYDVVPASQYRELKEQLETAERDAKRNWDEGLRIHEQFEAMRQRVIDACEELEVAGSDPAPLKVVLYALYADSNPASEPKT